MLSVLAATLGRVPTSVLRSKFAGAAALLGQIVQETQQQVRSVHVFAWPAAGTPGNHGTPHCSQCWRAQQLTDCPDTAASTRPDRTLADTGAEGRDRLPGHNICGC